MRPHDARKAINEQYVTLIVKGTVNNIINPGVNCPPAEEWNSCRTPTGAKVTPKVTNGVPADLGAGTTNLTYQW